MEHVSFNGNIILNEVKVVKTVSPGFLSRIFFLIIVPCIFYNYQIKEEQYTVNPTDNM